MTPRTGMLATVRNRRGLIRPVEPFYSTLEGRVHLVSFEYLDADDSSEVTLIWEREPKARLLEPTALPDPIRDAPMPPAELDALVRANVESLAFVGESFLAIREVERAMWAARTTVNKLLPR